MNRKTMLILLSATLSLTAVKEESVATLLKLSQEEACINEIENITCIDYNNPVKPEIGNAFHYPELSNGKELSICLSRKGIRKIGRLSESQLDCGSVLDFEIPVKLRKSGTKANNATPKKQVRFDGTTIRKIKKNCIPDSRTLVEGRSSPPLCTKQQHVGTDVQLRLSAKAITYLITHKFEDDGKYSTISVRVNKKDGKWLSNSM